MGGKRCNNDLMFSEFKYNYMYCRDTGYFKRFKLRLSIQIFKSINDF